MKIVFCKLLFLFFLNNINMKVVMNDMQKNYFNQIGLERKLSNLPEPPKERKLGQKIFIIKQPLRSDNAEQQVPLSKDFLQTIEDEINKQGDVQQPAHVQDQDIEDFQEQMMQEKDQHRQNLNQFDQHHQDMFRDGSNEQYDEKEEDHHHSREEEYENILNLINQSEDKLQHINLQNKKKVREHHDHSSKKTKAQKPSSNSALSWSSSEQEILKRKQIDNLFLDHLIRDNQQGQGEMKTLLNQLNEKFDQVIGLVKDIKDNGVGNKASQEHDKDSQDEKNQKIDIHIEEINKIFENLHQDEIKFQQQTGLGHREFSESERQIIKDILCLIENLPNNIRQKIVIPEQYKQMLHASQQQQPEKKQNLPDSLLQDLSEFIESRQQKKETSEDNKPLFTNNRDINYDEMIPLLDKNEKFDPHYTDYQNMSMEQLEQRRQKLVRIYLKEHPDFKLDQQISHSDEQHIQQRDETQNLQSVQADHEDNQDKFIIHHKIQTQPVISKYQSTLNHMESTEHKPQQDQSTQTHELVHDNVEHHDDHPESFKQKSTEHKPQQDQSTQTHELVHDNVEHHDDHPESFKQKTQIQNTTDAQTQEQHDVIVNDQLSQEQHDLNDQSSQEQHNVNDQSLQEQHSVNVNDEKQQKQGNIDQQTLEEQHDNIVDGQSQEQHNIDIDQSYEQHDVINTNNQKQEKQHDIDNQLSEEQHNTNLITQKIDDQNDINNNQISQEHNQEGQVSQGQLQSSQTNITQEQPQEKSHDLVYDNVQMHTDYPESHNNQIDHSTQDQEIQNQQQHEVIQDNQTQLQKPELTRDNSLEKNEQELMDILHNDQHVSTEHDNKQPNPQDTTNNQNLQEVEMSQIDPQNQVQDQIDKLETLDNIQIPQNGELSDQQKEQAILELAKANADPQEKKDWEKDEQMAQNNNVNVNNRRRRILL